MSTQVIRVHLEPPAENKALGLKGKSWILAGISSYEDLIGYFFLADGVTKSPSLGQHFSNLKPKDGTFTLELAAILPDLLPDLDGHPEYELLIKSRGVSQPLMFSNAMARVRYSKNGEPMHALVPRAAVSQVLAGEYDFVPKETAVETLRTMVATKFTIRGETAEAAFETHCEENIHSFICSINQYLKALPFVLHAPGFLCSIAYSRSTLPPLYFIVEGLEEKKFAHGWIAPHIGRAVVAPRTVLPDDIQQFKDYLDGTKTPDSIDSLLHSAAIFWESGVIEYVLLLSVIAAESMTQRFIHARLLNQGVSKNKIESVDKDLTYSVMLNAVIRGIVPSDISVDGNLIGRMNRARALRNEYMHQAKPPLSAAEVGQLLNDTKAYIAHIRSIEEQLRNRRYHYCATEDTSA